MRRPEAEALSLRLQKLLDEQQGKLFTRAVCQVWQDGPAAEALSACRRETLFDLASVTKIVTTVHILHEVTEGRLDPDAPLLEFLNDAPLGPVTLRRFQPVTPRKLLTHSSGLLPWYPFYTTGLGLWDAMEKALSSSPPEPAPVYSDLNFILLGEIVKRLASSLSAALFDLNRLLGTSLTYGPVPPETCAETENGNRIEARMCSERGLSFPDFRPPDRPIRGEANDGNTFYFFGGISGHAGIFASAGDLLRLGRLFLDEGRANGVQWIRPDLVRESFRDYGGGRGLGWRLSDIFPEGAGHTGFTGPSLWVAPKRGAAAVLLTNRLAVDPAPDLSDFRRKFHETVLEALS